MLWDQGEWEPQPGYTDVEAGLREGHLKFLMHGVKIKGKWALIRMAPRPKETKPSWLLIKEHDEFERSPEDEPVTDAEPNSVITGRSLEEIAANKDHVWNSNRPERQAGVVSAPRNRRHPEQSEGPPHFAPDLLNSLPKENQPTFLKPQLALETKSPPDASGWLHELKLDGYRIQGRKDGAKVQMLTRSGLDWTARMPAIAAEVARLPCEAATLDGEVVVLSHPTAPATSPTLQAAFQEGARNPLTYFCFDLLHLNGRKPRDLALTERKNLPCRAAQRRQPRDPSVQRTS